MVLSKNTAKRSAEWICKAIQREISAVRILSVTVAEKCRSNKTKYFKFDKSQTGEMHDVRLSPADHQACNFFMERLKTFF